MDPGIEFDLTGCARITEQQTEFLDHRERREIIMLGARP
jgi:hypothetical protein